MQKLWRVVSNIGIDKTLPYSLAKSSIFLNRICTVMLAFALSSIALNIFLGEFVFVLPLGIASGFLMLTYYLHYTKRYILAKSTVIITTLTLLIFMLLKAGTGSGIEFYFLCLIILPAIVFDEKRIIYFFQALSIIALVGQKIYEDIYLQEMVGSLATYRIFYIVNSIYSGLLVVLALSFFKNQYAQSEKNIIEQKKIIEEKNANLQLLNENLSRSNSDLEQFAYVASHDLKEPLRMISSFATLLSRKCADKDEDIQQYNQYISQGVARMQNLINDLLSYAQVNNEEKGPQIVDVNYILNDVKNYLSLSIDETDAQISYQELPIVYGIAPQLGQVFFNLLSNAIKFRRDEEIPKINIACKEDKDYWIFCVEDNGIGIDELYKEKIFVIFQRLHTTDKYPGTGIGLPLCKKIIERHRGKIWVESEPGKGTSVFFTLPKP